MKLRADLKAERQRQAIQRQKDWASLTPQEQLNALDQRLGKGLGAKRQRKLLMKESV